MTSSKNTSFGELLPCPFCGGKAEIHANTSAVSIKRYGQNRFWPVCINVLCPASGRYRSNESGAVKTWNRRTKVKQQDKSVTQIVNEAGFIIKTDSECDRIGPLNIVTISRDGKRTRRKARGYDEALMAAATARGVFFYGN